MVTETGWKVLPAGQVAEPQDDFQVVTADGRFVCRVNSYNANGTLSVLNATRAKCIAEVPDLIKMMTDIGDMHYQLIDVLKQVEGTEALRDGLYSIMDLRREIYNRIA